jgi:hypothetical protein
MAVDHDGLGEMVVLEVGSRAGFAGVGAVGVEGRGGHGLVGFVGGGG